MCSFQIFFSTFTSFYAHLISNLYTVFVCIFFLIKIFTLFLHRNDSSVCVDIPTNFTLCSDIGYKRMKLPNLLNHDTLAEVSMN